MTCATPHARVLTGLTAAIGLWGCGNGGDVADGTSDLQDATSETSADTALPDTADTVQPDTADTAVTDSAGETDAFDPLRPVVTTATYPRIDGSTSTLPLARTIACELLGLSYTWQLGLGSEGEAEIVPIATRPEDEPLASWVMSTIVHSRTHAAYTGLTDGGVDLILVANPPSPDERAYAEASSVTLEWEPIALDALVIIVNAANRVSGLSVEQVRAIFMGEITDWSEVGGPPGPISPYVRPENSGSQQLMNEIVMGGLTMPDWPEDRQPQLMGQLVDAIKTDPWAIGYSVYYFVTYQYPSGGYSILSVDGVTPAAESIRARSYPFVAPVWVVTRADLAPEGLAHRMHDWLLAPGGQVVIGHSGYVPLPVGP